MGVYDRIEIIKDKNNTVSPKNRPEYIYQIPLTFIPGIGQKTIDKLLSTFETEMNILHKLSEDDIEAVVGEKVAHEIVLARQGRMKIQEGGGRSIRKSKFLLKSKMGSIPRALIFKYPKNIKYL